MAIIHQVDQNTDAWRALRCGMPTASAFSKIITPAKGGRSKQDGGYMNAILAELMVGHPIYTPETYWMKWGHEHEDEAVAAYEFQQNIETERAGFVTTDDGLIGCSPDRFIGDTKMLQIKCPAPGTQAEYLIEGTLVADHRAQLQGELWVCEREEMHIVSYYPEMEAVVVIVERDEEFLAKMVPALREFTNELQEKIAMLIQRGLIKSDWQERMKPKPEEFEDDSEGLTEQDIEMILAENRRREVNG